MCHKELLRSDTAIQTEAGGYSGTAHKACFLAWLFKTPDGQEQIEVWRAGKPVQREQLDGFAADYLVYIKRGLIKSEQQKAWMA